jgi:ACT domain-containing protein
MEHAGLQPKAVVTVLGYDRKGIIAHVEPRLFEIRVNIVIFPKRCCRIIFNMVLIADISDPGCDFQALSTQLSELGDEMGLQIRIQRAEIFEAMHRI